MIYLNIPIKFTLLGICKFTAQMRHYLRANLSDFVMQVNVRKHCHQKLNLETDSPTVPLLKDS